MRKLDGWMNIWAENINIIPLRKKQIYIYIYIKQMYYVFLNKISPPVAVKARIDIIFDGKNILNWKMSDLNLSIHTSFKTIFLICEGTSNIT